MLFKIILGIYYTTYWKYRDAFTILDITPIHSGPQSDSPASSPRLEVVETSDTEIINNEPINDMISTTNTAELLRQNLLPSFAMGRYKLSGAGEMIPVSFKSYFFILEYKFSKIWFWKLVFVIQCLARIRYDLPFTLRFLRIDC